MLYEYFILQMRKLVKQFLQAYTTSWRQKYDLNLGSWAPEPAPFNTIYLFIWLHQVLLVVGSSVFSVMYRIF